MLWREEYLVQSHTCRTTTSLSLSHEHTYVMESIQPSRSHSRAWKHEPKYNQWTEMFMVSLKYQFWDIQPATSNVSNISTQISNDHYSLSPLNCVKDLEVSSRWRKEKWDESSHPWCWNKYRSSSYCSCPFSGRKADPFSTSVLSKESETIPM